MIRDAALLVIALSTAALAVSVINFLYRLTHLAS